MQGSSIMTSNASLMKLINKSLDVFDRNNLVRCVDGYYYTRKIQNGIEIQLDVKIWLVEILNAY